MHHVVVKRVALSLWVFIGLASVAFGWIASRAPQSAATTGFSVTDAGREAFTRDCADCHDCAELAAPGGSAVPLVRKLATHGPSSVEDDLAIVAYLVSDLACLERPAPHAASR